MPAEHGLPGPEPLEPGSAPTFRWPSFFQQTTDAIFVLSRHLRLRFVNRAWESLTGHSLAEVRGLSCRRRNREPEAGTLELLQHALAPSAEVLQGRVARVRRLVPSSLGPDSWDIDFWPLGSTEGTLAILGRIRPVFSPEHPFPPIPEKILALRERWADRNQFSGLESAHPALVRVREQVRLAANQGGPVALVGEPGTGKQWLARLIHRQGSAREDFFAALDCARLPVAALVSVLFGDPGRSRVKTFYLMDPGHLPRDIQERLLTWLNHGSETSAPGQPRIISGITTSPEADLQSGRMLAELWYRLSPITVALLPLRERLADLPGLVRDFLPRATQAADREVKGVSDAALEVLSGYRWPGNLQELYGILVGACERTSSERIEPGDLPFHLRGGPLPVSKSVPLDVLLEKVERRLLELALKKSAGNKTRAAEWLAIWRPRLIRRLEALGIQGPEAKDES